MILSALTDYDTGFTLEETAARLKKKTHRNCFAIDRRVVAGAVQTPLQLSSSPRKGLSRFPANQTIRTIKLYHRQIYIRVPSAEARFPARRRARRQAQRRQTFRAARRFSRTRSDGLSARTLQWGRGRQGPRLPGRATFADTTHAIVNIRENAATETAALIIPAVGNNKLRHETLQRFMLANDSVTLAVEIPIWLREPDIAAIEARWGINLAARPRMANASLPATSTSSKSGMAPCISSTTSPTRRRISRSCS